MSEAIVDSPGIAPVPTSDDRRFKFTGDGLEFLILLLKNFFLTLFTLGIYYFWASVEVRKYIYGHTYFYGHNFEYHATGKEKFIGFLKFLGLLFGYMIVVGIIAYLITLIAGETVANLITQLIGLVVLAFAAPFFIIQGRRFNLRRTSFRGIRFQMQGDYKEFVKIFAVNFLLTAITFGIYTPFFAVKISEYITRNSLYGNHAFDFRGTGKDLFFVYLKGLLLIMITCGIYFPWFIASVFRFFIGNIYFQDGKFDSDLTGVQKFIVSFLTGLSFMTLGIAYPWVLIYNYKITLGSVSFSNDINFDSIVPIAATDGNALGDAGTSSTFGDMADIGGFGG